MRTKSTQTLKDKQPKAKWDGVMSMFREWKHHNAVAEGQQVYVIVEPTFYFFHFYFYFSAVHPPPHISPTFCPPYRLNRKPSTAAGSEPVIVHNQEDLIALRQAIYSLKQRKNLSKADQALLKKMQQKLAGTLLFVCDSRARALSLSPFPR